MLYKGVWEEYIALRYLSSVLESSKLFPISSAKCIAERPAHREFGAISKCNDIPRISKNVVEIYNVAFVAERKAILWQ